MMAKDEIECLHKRHEDLLREYEVVRTATETKLLKAQTECENLAKTLHEERAMRARDGTRNGEDIATLERRVKMLERFVTEEQGARISRCHAATAGDVSARSDCARAKLVYRL